MAKPAVPPGLKKKIERDAKRVVSRNGFPLDDHAQLGRVRADVNANRAVIRALIATVEAQQTALEEIHARLTALEDGSTP